MKSINIIGKKEEKQNSDIRGKKRHFGEAMPEVMPEIAKKMCPGAAQSDKGRKEQKEQFWWG